MILKNTDYIRDEIVEELVQRRNAAIGEVEDEYDYITAIEIIVAGSKMRFLVSGGET